MIPIRYAVTVFITIMVILLVALMPPAVLLHVSGLSERVAYANATGSIAQMEFTDLSIEGKYIGDVSFIPDITDFLFGIAGGEVFFSGAGRQGQMTFELNSDAGHLSVQDMMITTPLVLETSFGPLAGLVQIRTEESEISLKEGCQSGTFILSSTLLDDVFARAGLSASPLKGQAVCQRDGTLNIDMESTTDDIIITITAETSSIQDWRAPEIEMDAEIKPVQGKLLPSSLTLMFNVAGLPQRDGAYRLPLILGPD